jgi:hypothetical protein
MVAETGEKRNDESSAAPIRTKVARSWVGLPPLAIGALTSDGLVLNPRQEGRTEFRGGASDGMFPRRSCSFSEANRESRRCRQRSLAPERI